MEPQPPAKHGHYAFIAVLAVSIFVFFFGLGGLGILGPDEPRYAEVAREMFVSGDYISTRLCGCLWFEKPALLYWMSAAAYHVFGVNELAARIPSALAALATVALMYWVLRRLGFKQWAFTASLVVATSGIFIAYARVGVPDMILTASMTASLLAVPLAIKASGRARATYWMVSFFFVGLAVLAKGLVGIALAITIVTFYLLLTRQIRSVRWQDCAIGLAVFLLVAGSWYVPVTLRHGWPFIDDFFLRHHIERYTTNEFGHPQPIYFFGLVALAGAAPWTFFLMPAFARLRSLRSRQEARHSLLTLAWIWTAVPLLFFSFSESKLPGYILPIFPAIALIIGAEVERLLNGVRSGTLATALWLTALMLVGIGIGFILSPTAIANYLRTEPPEISGWRTGLAALPLAIAVVSVVVLAARRRRAFVASATAVVVSLILAAVILLFPSLRDELSLKSLSLEAAAALRPGEKIAFYLKKEFAPVFYAEGRVLCEPKRGTTFYALHQSMLADALESEGSLVVITDSHWLEGLEGDPRLSTEFIASQGDALALRVVLKK